MNAEAREKQDEPSFSNMKKPALYSVLLHVIVIVLATFGLPYFVTKTEPIEMAMTVDLVDISEISQTNKVDKPQNNKADDKPKENKPVYNSAESSPDLLSPKPPKVEDIPEPPKEKPKPDPVVKKEPPPKPQNKPKPPEPPKEKPKDPPKEKPEEKKPEKDITSLLKSLTPDEPSEKTPPVKETTPDNQGQVSQISDFGKELTRSELENLNAGVQPCWNVNAGGKNAEDLIVSLRVFINPDMRVREVQILDQIRYNTDTHYKAAAESARRALLNPNCSTLRIPPEKYEQWKVFKYNFDPSDML